MLEKNYSSFAADGALFDEISLVKLSGRQIKDIQGYIFQDGKSFVFSPVTIVFDDGTEIEAGSSEGCTLLFGNLQAERHLRIDSETLKPLYQEKYP